MKKKQLLVTNNIKYNHVHSSNQLISLSKQRRRHAQVLTNQ